MSHPTEPHGAPSGADIVLGHDPSVTDSAGQPWSGRSFSPNQFVFDTGEISKELAEVFEHFNTGKCGQSEVVAGLTGQRLLVPLVAQAGETGVDAAGRTVDKSQELSLVTVQGPDGRPVLPAFTSVEALNRWNQNARPIPVDAARVALAAGAERTDLVVLDPGSPTEFVLRRRAIEALARGESWTPPWLDADVVASFRDSVADDERIVDITIASGDPRSTLEGPEVLAVFSLVPGLTSDDVREVVQGAQEYWRRSDVILERVESIAIQVRPAGD